MIGLLDTAFLATVGRRSGPVPGMALWLKSSSLALSDNDPVATWPDLSGNGNDATQATSAKRPAFKAGILNGKGVVRFDGVDDFLSCALSRSQPYTIFAVPRFTGATNARYLIDGATENEGIIYVASSSEVGIYGGAGLVPTAPFVAADWNIIAAVFNGSSSTIAVNGAVTPVVIGVGGTTGTTIGANPAAGGSNLFPGDIAEILIYPTALSDPDREAVEAYLNSEYAIF